MKLNRQQFHRLGLAAVFVGMLLAPAIHSSAQTVTILDAPGAGTAIHQEPALKPFTLPDTSSGTTSTREVWCTALCGKP